MSPLENLDKKPSACPFVSPFAFPLTGTGAGEAEPFMLDLVTV